MSLSLQDKHRFFLQLAQLLRSGIPLPQAAEKLRRTGSGGQRATAKALGRRLEQGDTASEALASLHGHLGAMERSCLAASARTGRLEGTLQKLGEYFEVFHRARAEIRRHCAYPFFVLHTGILVVGLPVLFREGGQAEYVRQTLTLLAWLWGSIVAAALAWPLLREAAATSSLLDHLLRRVPLLGRIRRDLGLARFFGTYDMQLEAGVNVMDSLCAAADASRLGALHRAARRALPALREGESVGPLLDRSGALPDSASGALIVAEDTGELHRTLPQLQQEYEESGLRRLEVATEWLPRLLSVAVMGYIGYRIIMFYKGYLSLLDSIGP